MADRKYLAGNLEFARAELPRSAKPALNLSCLKDSPVELRLLAAQDGQLFLERTDFFRTSVPEGSLFVLWLFGVY